MHERTAQSLGLLPWQAARVSPRDLEGLARGARLGHNREGRLAAWVIAWMPWAVAMGIRIGLSDEKVRGMSFDDMLNSQLDYDASPEGDD